MIYLSIELFVNKKNTGMKYRAAECCFPRVHNLRIMPKVEAKNFKRPTVCSCGFFSQSMISWYTTKRSAQTPTGGGMFQRTASLGEKLTTAELGPCFFFSTATVCCDIHVCGLSERKEYIYCSIYIFKKNVNIGQRCSSLRTVQSHERW